MDVILEVVVKFLGGLHGGPVVQLVTGRAARKVWLEVVLHCRYTHPRLWGSISLPTSSCKVLRLLLKYKYLSKDDERNGESYP